MLRHLKHISSFFFIASALAILAAATLYYALTPQLAPGETIKETQLQVPLRVYSAEGLTFG